MRIPQALWILYFQVGGAGAGEGPLTPTVSSMHRPDSAGGCGRELDLSSFSSHLPCSGRELPWQGPGLPILESTKAGAS